jgi:beta-glucosidase/6-phospho-beta-glucosidase/beta-galactosidase
VHVDYPTQRRTAKDSAFWYRRFLQRQRAQQGGPVLATHSV